MQIFCCKDGRDEGIAVCLDALDEVLHIAQVHHFLELSDYSADYCPKLSLLQLLGVYHEIAHNEVSCLQLVLRPKGELPKP